MTPLAALVFARCVGFVVRAPGFSHASGPVPVRAALAYALAVGLVPALGRANSAPPAVPLVAALVFEFLLGAAIGFAASLLYEGAAAGGRMLDEYVGIQVANPAATLGTGQAFQQLWGLGFLAAFFVLDGYQVVILALADSLTRIPPGDAFATPHLDAFAVAVPGIVLRAGLLVAGPALALGLVANVALGSISRIIPRFSNFTLTFPVVFFAVLLATLVTLPVVLQQGGRPWLPAALSVR